MEHVAALKAQPGRELQVHGSGRFAQSLLAAELVDEVRLVVSPAILGEGRRLFADRGPALGLRAAEHSVTSGGLTILVFETTGPAAFAAYEGVASGND
jgi:dihydrofolate reductase